jgi:hypothetical protein
MKQRAIVFGTVLLIAVVTSLAACSGGIFIDPGHESAGGGGGNDEWLDNGDGGDGGGGGSGDGGSGEGGDSGGGNEGGSSGGSKPAALATNASYSQATAKVNEIITYCDAHPGTKNDSIKIYAQAVQGAIDTYQSSGLWSSLGPSAITQINSYIDQLE